MKTIKLLVLLCIIGISAFAQNTSVDKIFDRYAEKEGFTTVIISKQMFSLFANTASKNNEDDFSKIITGLESIRILSIDDSILNSKINLYKELIKDFPLDKYEQLMVIKEKGQDIRMMVRKENVRIIEFIMIGGGNDNFLICITGKLDLDAISKLSNTMNIKGLDNVDKLKSNQTIK